MLFHDRLESLLHENNLTWKKVSSDCHIGKNMKKYWKDRDIVPQTETLSTLAKYFNVSVDYLRGIDELKQESLNAIDNLSVHLNQNELKVIMQYRELDDEGKIIVESTIIREKRRMIEEKGTHVG